LNTFISYSFAEIGEDNKISFANSKDEDHLQELSKKAAATDTKVLVAVGGWTFSEGEKKDRFSIMIGSSENRATFINSAREFIYFYKIDGIDIDFGTILIQSDSVLWSSSV